MLNFINKYTSILLFGVFQIFFSSVGQTFLISLFVASIVSDLGVTQTKFASIYSAATLIAALFLNPAGRLIDKYKTDKVVIITALLMSLGCILLSASTSLIMLFASFFILRMIGQGVFVLTSSTLLVKKFHRNRARSIGISILGYPFGEFVYPSIAMIFLSNYGFRGSFRLFALSYIFLMIPLQLFLLRKSEVLKTDGFFDDEFIDIKNEIEEEYSHILVPSKQFTLKEVLKDYKFYILLISSCLPPVVMTSLLFHQKYLFEVNGWHFSYAAKGLALYAFFKALGSFFIGPVIDKKGPFLIFIIMILFLGSGTLLSSFGGHRYMVYLYYGLLGIALGFSSPVTNVIWPGLYGTKHIGSIKGFIATVRNGVTALGPLPIALALDNGISINFVLKVMGIIVCLLATLPAILFLKIKR